MTGRAYLVSKAERELSAGMPRVKVSIEKPKEGDHKGRLIAVSGLTGAALTQLAVHSAIGAGVSAGGKKLWRTGRRYIASRRKP